MQPKVCTIAAHRPFLATLAAGLLEMAGADPLQLPRITVLLPTRRAVRSLRDAFLRVAPDGKEVGTPLLLPRMRPIGDLDSDELSLSNGGGESLQGAILAVEPEHVAVDDEKDVAEQRQRLRDAAAGIEQLGFMGNIDAGVVAAGKLRGDHRCLVMHIDDDPFDPDERQPVDRMIEQGAAVYLDQRFRNAFRHRPQPGPEPGGEHHCRLRQNDHAEICRAERGRWRSNHRAIGVRAGWASS